MNIALSDTIFYVTGKQGIENTTQQELQTMVADYPYFAPAQLVYAAKLKSENSFKLQTQIQKAGLFFNNFKWLQYQLMEVNVGNFVSTVPANHMVHQEPIAAEQKTLEPVFAKPAVAFYQAEQQEELLPKEEEVHFAEPIETAVNTAFEHYDVAETIPANANNFMSNMSIPTIEDVKGIMNGIDEKKEEIVEENTTEIIAAVEVEPNQEPIASAIVFDKYEPDIIEEIPTSTNDIHAEIAAMKANWNLTHPTESIGNIENKIEEYKPGETQQPSAVEMKLSSELAAIKSEFNKPVEDLANEPLSFETEPYYTIDYFASQGIKFDYTKDPQDKLTAKMLKFTDWLKKMKSPKPEINIMVDDPELDKAIQNIAATSNQSKEIVTETMAEIFAKQGKTEKAIQLYIKLSFLIPDKSAYFATKIKELKGI